MKQQGNTLRQHQQMGQGLMPLQQPSLPSSPPQPGHAQLKRGPRRQHQLQQQQRVSPLPPSMQRRDHQLKPQMTAR